MKEPSIRRISIFVSVDEHTVYSYFNPHDPAPLGRRQLSHDFQDYLNQTLIPAGRYTTIDFKVFCNGGGNMRFIIEPLIKTIRRHFQMQKKLKENEFRKFKKRNYLLLMVSFMVVMICQGIVPIVLGEEHRIHSIVSNAVDVFSWVILWKPIERLIFYWNPFLKDILLLTKVINAKVNIVESEEDLINYHLEHYDAA
jgi:hypothetical protein